VKRLSGKIISRIWIYSHGESGKLKFIKDAKFDVQDMLSVAAILGELTFAPDISLHFSGCNVFEDKDETYITRVADTLKLKTGRLYANESKGFAMREMAMKISVFETKDFEHCVTQLFAPISYPTFLLMDTFFTNKGTLFVRAPNSSDCFEDAKSLDIWDEMETGEK
jgi:hypothetical protein